MINQRATTKSLEAIISIWNKSVMAFIILVLLVPLILVHFLSARFTK